MSISIHCSITKCENSIDNVLSEYSPGDGWNRITMNISPRHSKIFHICPDCSKKFGIEAKKTSPDQGQALLDILYDIVQEEISNSRE